MQTSNPFKLTQAFLKTCARRHSRVSDEFPFTILNTHKPTLIQTVEADEGSLTPWLFACLIARVYWPNGRPKGIWSSKKKNNSGTTKGNTDISVILNFRIKSLLDILL